MLARSSPTPALQGPVSFYHGRDIHRIDALGRLLESFHYYGPDGTGGLYQQEAFEYDGLGRTRRESFKFLVGANWVDVESGFTGGDPVRTSVHYDNNLAADADDLWLDYAPDAIGRLAQMHWRTTSGGTPELLGEYLHEGAPIRRRTTHWGTGSGQSFHTDYRYDPWGRMDKIEQSFSAAATVEFVYDGGVVNGFLVSASNLVKEVYQKQGGSNQKGDRFAYDEHHRLAKSWLGSDQTHLDAADPEAAVGTWVKKLTYGLDAANNRTSVASQAGPGGTVTTEAYSTQDSGEPGGESNRYDAVGGVEPEYDERGNTIFDGSFYYVYDDQNRLSEVYILTQESESSSLSSSTSSLSSSSALVTRSSSAGSYRVTDMTALLQARTRILTRLPGGPTEILARAGEPGLGSTLREALSPTVVQRVDTTSNTLSTSSTTSSSTQSLPYAQLSLVAVYFYDSANRRVARSVIGAQTWFTAWDGWSEAQELIASGANVVPQRQFVWGEQLDELVSYRYRQPGQGSWAEFFVAEGGAHCPSRVLNDQGQVVEVQEYDAYGKASFYNGSGTYVGEGTQAAVGNPFQWKGHRVDPETGLMYMRNRYYSVKWGRFMTQDPLGVWGDAGNSGNSYAYGSNEPLGGYDPFGLQWIEWHHIIPKDAALAMYRKEAGISDADIDAKSNGRLFTKSDHAQVHRDGYNQEFLDRLREVKERTGTVKRSDFDTIAKDLAKNRASVWGRGEPARHSYDVWKCSANRAMRKALWSLAKKWGLKRAVRLVAIGGKQVAKRGANALSGFVPPAAPFVQGAMVADDIADAAELMEAGAEAIDILMGGDGLDRKALAMYAAGELDNVGTDTAPFEVAPGVRDSWYRWR